MNFKEIDKLLAKRMEELAQIRDKLEDDIDTLQELRSNSEEAWYNLEAAREALSRLV
jgi:Skp family chaperone for outer membrane proteins